MTTPVTRTSGTSKKATVLPAVLKYPQIHEFTQVIPHLKNHLCYLLKHYNNDGISVVIQRRPKEDKIAVIFGDWKGNTTQLDLKQESPYKSAALSFAEKDLALFIRTMQLIKLEQAQFFLAFGPTGLILTDIQISINKLCGPGMVRDIFGKIYPVPELIKVEILDDRAIEFLQKGSGHYEGDIIIKPSRFLQFSPKKGSILPLYAEIKRN